MILCQCGCNQEATYGNWVIGHWNKGRIAWNKGLSVNDERVKKYVRKGKEHHFYGGHHTLESRQRMSNSLKGKTKGDKHYSYGKKHTNAHNLKISNSLKGRIVSEETRSKLSIANKGRIGWNKGLTKKSDERIRQHSNSMTGKTHSSQTKCKMSNAQKGQLHWNWQGGISFIPYCSKFNKQLKEKIRGRDNYKCQLCYSPQNGTKLTVHHIHYDKENCYPDLISLCKSCNSKVNKKELRQYYEQLFMNILNNKGLLFWRHYATH